jgi:outer membrane lipoprotein LolB
LTLNTPPRPRRGRLLTAALAGMLLAACTHPPVLTGSPANGAADHWSGRLALQVQDAPSQSFSAGFELSGGPERGELLLFSPLGSTLARLQWSPGGALLLQGDQRRQSPSLQALTRELTGSELPVAALFGWLKGQAVQATGWEADLSALGQGRIAATRQTPAPQASLRIVLD